MEKAEHFNNSAAKKESQSEQIIEKLKLKIGSSVIDFGSGGGFYTGKFAEIVGENGTVYAIDKNKELLNYITNKIKSKNVINVFFDGNIDFAEANSIDLIFMRNVTHHLKNRTKLFKKLGKLLKKDGKFAVIDYKVGKLFSFHGLFRHSVKQQKIQTEMQNAGFKVFKEYKFIEHQHFTIFQKL